MWKKRALKNKNLWGGKSRELFDRGEGLKSRNTSGRKRPERDENWVCDVTRKKPLIKLPKNGRGWGGKYPHKKDGVIKYGNPRGRKVKSLLEGERKMKLTLPPRSYKGRRKATEGEAEGKKKKKKMNRFRSGHYQKKERVLRKKMRNYNDPEKSRTCPYDEKGNVKRERRGT